MLKKQKDLDCDDDDDEEVIKRKKPKRRLVRKEYDSDEEDGLDVQDSEVAKMPEEAASKEETLLSVQAGRTEASERQAAPGKVLVKVKKTRMFMDAKGYMVNEDYSCYDEVDEKKAKKTKVIDLS